MSFDAYFQHLLIRVDTKNKAFGMLAYTRLH